MSARPTHSGNDPRAQYDDTDLATRTRHRWYVESWNHADGWALASSPSNSPEEAAKKQLGIARRHPGIPTRITRETTTWTLENTDG